MSRARDVDFGVRVSQLEEARIPVVKRPVDMNRFEFAVLSGLRAQQLHRGCTPRVEQSNKVAVTAQQEIAEGKVVASTLPFVPVVEPVSAPSSSE